MMKKGTWDYNCPQFVDFAADLSDNSGKDVFFDCDDPEQDKTLDGLQSSDLVKTCLSPSTENIWMSKMTAALDSIKNTPKIAMIRQHQLNNTTLKKPHFRFGLNSHYKENVQSSIKMPRSKSSSKLNEIGKANKVSRLRKSSSLSDLKVVKKQTYPMTPMCLKRTIIKGRNKVLKSTEEMELEEIARLQKELKQHLRYNEMSLKRLNLKPRPGFSQKSNQPKPQHAKEVNDKGGNQFVGRLNCVVKNEKRRDLNKLSHDAFKKEAMKINAVINKHKSKMAPIFPNVEVNKHHLLGQAVSTKVQKSPVFHKKIGFHSGIFFQDSMKKTTVVQPFNFSTTSKKIKTENNLPHNIDGIEKSIQNVKLCDGKENVPVNKVLPTFVRSIKGVKNQNVDGNKILESIKKMVDKRTGSRNRGLSENISRV